MDFKETVPTSLITASLLYAFFDVNFNIIIIPKDDIIDKDLNLQFELQQDLLHFKKFSSIENLTHLESLITQFPEYLQYVKIQDFRQKATIFNI